MAIYRPVLTNTYALPNPLSVATETTPFSGNNRKIYLSPVGGCGYNYVVNGGGNTQTDWLNPTNGLAQYWAIEETTTNTVTTQVNNGGNGFTDNHQYLTGVLSPHSYIALLSFSSFTPVVMGSRSYRISVKYRSNAAVGIWVRKNNTSWGSDIYWGALSTNEGNAAYGFADVTITNTVGSYITSVFMGHSQTEGSFSWWFDVDEVHMCDLGGLS